MVTYPQMKSIGVAGCGLIGMSWAALFLAKGFDVSATDPVASAEGRLRAFVDEVWPQLIALGLADRASRSRLSFSTDMGKALAGVDFVQENGPERLELKRKILSDISAIVGENVIIASSSSGLMASTFQDAAKNPGRVLIGHPFNPPHLVPLVEIVGGAHTDEQVIVAAMDFYRSIGKRPIRLRKEMKGHIANRIQAAVVREVLHLLNEDVASIADIDAAMSEGPGLRWALLGQFMNSHLGGGEGGFAGFAKHLGPALEDWWSDLGTETKISPESVQKAIAGLKEEMRSHTPDAIARARDDALIRIIAAKAAEPALPK